MRLDGMRGRCPRSVGTGSSDRTVVDGDIIGQYIALHGYVAAHAFIGPGLVPGQNRLQDAPVIQMIGQRPPIASQLELTIGQSVLCQLVSGLRQHVIMSRLDRSEEHTSELQSLMRNSYAVFCLKKKKPN